MSGQADQLDCHAASRLISAALDDAVTPDESERLQRHFVICRTCRTVDAQMAFLREAMRRLGEEGDRDAIGPPVR
jgi:predicted anti-sigma-YlaC factor YlaD